MNISEIEQKLVEIYRKKKENGLVHVSFAVNAPVTAENKEQVIEDILAIETAITEGKVSKLDFGDLRWKQADFLIL